jgi:hypothetical protein
LKEYNADYHKILGHFKHENWNCVYRNSNALYSIIIPAIPKGIQVAQ